MSAEVTAPQKPADPEEVMRAATSTIIERFNWARQMGMTFNGDRDIYSVLGYNTIITAQEYRDRYGRGGIARRVVDALPTAVWRGVGRVYEDDSPEATTQFEKDWEALNKQLRMWSTLQRAHILASLSSFSVLLLGAPGSLDTELPKGKPGQILYITPFGGGVINTASSNTRIRGQASGVGSDVTVARWDEDVNSPRFGQPLYYKLKRTNFNAPEMQKEVHWTRVLHVPASGFLDDALFGPPTLEAVWNYFDDLDKVVGGGAEAFWMRANGGLQIDVDKKMQLSDANNTLASLQEQAAAYEHGISRIMRTRGVNIKQLGSDVADFGSPADTIVTLIAGTSGIPKRILTGSERGELASSQDRDNWNDQVKDCRSSYAEPVIVRPLVDRLVAYGYLSEPKQYEVWWPDAAAMTEMEKLDAASKAAGLNDHGEIVITSAEIRETYLDREPLDEEEVEEEEEAQAEEAIVERLEAAVRGGGSLNIEVKPRRAKVASIPQTRVGRGKA